MNLDSLKSKEYFDSFGKDQFNRDVVFVKNMNVQILQEIEDLNPNNPPLVYFAISNLKDNSYVKTIDLTLPSMFDDFEEDLNLQDLRKDLLQMEKEVGLKTLQEMIDETHDGIQSLTHHAAKYPKIGEKLSQLYDVYGYDILFEELS